MSHSSSSSSLSSVGNTYDMDNVSGHSMTNIITVRDSNSKLREKHKTRLAQFSTSYYVTLEKRLQKLFDAFQNIHIERWHYRQHTAAAHDQAFDATLLEINKRLEKLQKAYHILFSLEGGKRKCCYCNCGGCREDDEF